MKWYGSVLNPKNAGHGPRPLFLGDADGEATHTMMGFCCVADAHNIDGDVCCPGNDHGGWTDTAEMVRAMADAMENPGCDIRQLIEPLEAKT